MIVVVMAVVLVLVMAMAMGTADGDDRRGVVMLIVMMINTMVGS